jgi:hypothetical protein
VTIKADSESLGKVIFRKWPKWVVHDSQGYNERRSRAWFENRTQISLAGQIAEAIHAGRHQVRYSHATDDDDAADCAMGMCSTDEECTAWLNWLFIWTRNLLEMPRVWNAVEALAEESMKQETILDAEVRNIAQTCDQQPRLIGAFTDRVCSSSSLMQLPIPPIIPEYAPIPRGPDSLRHCNQPRRQPEYRFGSQHPRSEALSPEAKPALKRATVLPATARRGLAAGCWASAASTRCFTCERDTDARIKRNPAARRGFRRSNPCPATGKTSGGVSVTLLITSLC